jgi:hypothetical protein
LDLAISATPENGQFRPIFLQKNGPKSGLFPYSESGRKGGFCVKYPDFEGIFEKMAKKMRFFQIYFIFFQIFLLT